jgi:hypothetical protein
VTAPVSPWNDNGTVMKAGATPEQVAAWMAWEGSGWRFAEDPASAIGHCSTAAAQALSGWSGGSFAATIHDARFWTQVGLLLVALADNPKIQVGAVLGGFADELGLR